LSFHQHNAGSSACCSYQLVFTKQKACQQKAIAALGYIQIISTTFQIGPQNQFFAIRRISKFRLKNFEIKKLLCARSNAMRRDKCEVCVRFQLTKSIFALKVNLNNPYFYFGGFILLNTLFCNSAAENRTLTGCI